MADLQRVTPSPAGVHAALTIATATCLAAGIGFAAIRSGGDLAGQPDPCALPRGIDFAVLGEHDRSVAARHAMACSDYEHRRITAEEYRATIAALDAVPVPAPVPPPAIVWASSIRDISTQYSGTSWSAARALGAPDVFPASGDNANAWASRGADDRVEYLEVGFEGAGRIRGVEIYETFNPGAISQVELIFASGRRQSIHAGTAQPLGQPSYRRRIDVTCTSEPVVAVRVTLDSPAVAGWNEIDAIGAIPCEAPSGR